MTRRRVSEKGQVKPAHKPDMPRLVGSMVLGPVARAVRPVIRQILPKSSAAFQQLFEAWPDLMAGTEAATAMPEKMVFPRGSQKEAVLHVWARTGAQAMDMTFGAPALVTKINLFFGYGLVRDMRVTAFPTAAAQTNTNPESPRAVRDTTYSMSCQGIDKNLAGISNPGLRSLLWEFAGTLGRKSPQNNTKEGDGHA